MVLSTLISTLERFAPSAYQESYDNSRLIVGNLQQTVTGVLLCLDTLESIVDEAIETDCNVIIAHHPIVFSGLKSLTGRNYVERVVLKAIKNDIAIYACHTNLDNVRAGVNAKICARLDLKNTRILAPKSRIIKQLSTYVPVDDAAEVRDALFAVGAGKIGNYSETSFNSVGAGTFKGNDLSNAHSGKKNVRHYEAETKIELVFEAHQEAAVLRALHQSHPYEEIAYNIISLENVNKAIGAGMIGELDTPLNETDFLQLLKNQFNAACVRHTPFLNKPIKTVAVCGGSGSFLLRNAISAKADVFVTADFKYHEFFDADNHLVIADIGHYETEQFTIDLFEEILKQNFVDLRILKTNINTNSVRYF
ncbi:MAG: hypothetical protein RI894_1623 [Bacteroidota bacterium]|jgi:dinuclear metal center YbgI/SA1388 family protein